MVPECNPVEFEHDERAASQLILMRQQAKVSLPFSDCWQDEEHPEVNPKNQNDLKDQLPQNRLSQIQSPVYHHGTCRQTDGQ